MSLSDPSDGRSSANKDDSLVSGSSEVSLGSSSGGGSTLPAKLGFEDQNDEGDGKVDRFRPCFCFKNAIASER